MASGSAGDGRAGPRQTTFRLAGTPSGGDGFAGVDVLVVEDQLVIAMDLEDELTALGAGVRLAASVTAALAAIDERPPHCAVLDLGLGGETSLPVAEKLARHAVPFVFATGYDDPVMIPERFRAVPIVGKPVDVRELVDKLGSALRAS